MASFVSVCYLGFDFQLLGVVAQQFSCVIEFTETDPLYIYHFPDLCDELDGPF